MGKESSETPDMAHLAGLVHRQDIHDCLLRFSRGMDRFDRALFLSAFHEDEVIAAGEFVGNREDLYEWARDLHGKAQTATRALPFEGFEDLALNGVPGRNRQDPSYQRPLVNRRRMQLPSGFTRPD